MQRWVCPPWYECSCSHLGKLVSKSTVIRHRKAANQMRAEIGRGIFKWAPKVANASVEKFNFDCIDSLEEHPTDVESDDEAALSSTYDIGNGVSLANPAIEPNQLRNSAICCDPPENLHVLEGEEHNADFSGLIELPQGNLEMSDPQDVPSAFNPAYDFEELVAYDSEEEEDLNSPTGSADASMMELWDVGRHTAESETLYWIRNNKGWVDLYYNYGLTISAMDAILKLVGAPCKSWKTVRSNIVDNSELYKSLEHYETCPGHMCYATRAETEEVLECSVCGKPKPSTADVNVASSVTYIPLEPRIRSMIEVEGKVDQLYGYRHSRSTSTTHIRDYFDSAAYKNLCDMYGGPENVRYDIFISASTDGFQAFKNNSCDVWPVVGVLFNLPPHQRSYVKNLMPLMFIPNSVEPKDLQSFLVPLVNEIKRTNSNGGTKMRFPDDIERRVRLHLIMFTTDLAALVKTGGVNGVNGRLPCRFCWIEGYYVRERKHYYFPSWLHSEEDPEERITFYNPRRLRLRSEHEIELIYERLESAPTRTQRNNIATETGIKERTVLCSLPSMTPFDSFPPDIMHLMYNVQKELLQHHLSGLAEPYAVPHSEIAFLEEELLAFGSGISGQISTMPKKLSRFTSWKAADHKAFTLSYALIVFDGYISEPCMNGLQSFVQLSDICFRPSISKREAGEVKTLAVRFLESFENLYVRHDRKLASFCKYILHLLLHLGDAILHSGPLVCSSQYPMEKYIGWIVDRCNARFLPAKSMLISTLFGECYKTFFRVDFEKGFQNEALSDDEAHKFLGPKRDIRISELERGPVWFQTLLRKYLKRKFVDIDAREATRIAETIQKIRLWSRYRFPCGSDVQVASIYKKEGRYRPSHYVAVEMDKTDCSADIYYGRLIHLMEFKLTVSMPVNHANGSNYPYFPGGVCRVAILQWAERMERGNQGQIFKTGSRENAFGSISMEDTSIVQRLISVVEHAVPSTLPVQHGHSEVVISARKQKRTYFIDDLRRLDYLLQPTRESEDGVNRVLKGLRRR